jgi:hypothetical protein
MDFPILSAQTLSDWRGDITTFNGFTGTRPEHELKDATWSDACNLVCPDTPTVITDKKLGKYFLPCLLKDAPLVGNTLEAAKNTGRPTSGKMRSKSHVTKASMLVIDVDGLSEADFTAGRNKMVQDGVAYLGYTTHSHGREDRPGTRARIVMPLDRALDQDEYAQAWHGADVRYWGGLAGQADASGANLYQQQGTWACDPTRVVQASKWVGTGGVISAESLVANGKDGLAEPGQESIDAVSRHNGRVAPRAPEAAPSPRISWVPQSQIIARLGALLCHIDPDCGYDDWLHVLMAVHYETGGSDDGLELADTWSSKGKKYVGHDEIRDKWRSFRSDQENHFTIATLIHIVEAKGLDWLTVCAAVEPQFKRCDYTVVQPAVQLPDAPTLSANPLDKFSLRGMSGEIEKRAVDEKPVLGQLALQGQATVFHAAPNTGKTLITLSLLIDAIQHGRVDPSKIYYLNMDDTNSGVLEKLRIAEEYGFHLLAEGHQGFSANQFLGQVAEMIENDQAHGVIVILDTLKKFVNLMDKIKSSSFTTVIRQFVMKGGTLIALAHTNKNPGRDGKPVYAGTSDIIDDFDCAYTLAPVTSQAGSGEKVVEFENKKRRGNVVPSAGYSYSIEHGMPYVEILLSVQPVDATQLVPLKQAEQIRSDAEVITSVIACIGEGVNTKMKLAEAVAKRAGVSKRAALQIIEKYTGDDPAQHQWAYSLQERGAKVYALLDHTPSDQGLDAAET